MKSFLMMLLRSGYIPEQIERDWQDDGQGNSVLVGVLYFKKHWNSPVHTSAFAPLSLADYDDAFDLFQAYWRGMEPQQVP